MAGHSALGVAGRGLLPHPNPTAQALVELANPTTAALRPSDGNDDCAYDDINCCCGGEVGTMRRVDLWWFEDLCSGYYLYLSE